jgi:hypothetical protein
MEKTNPYSLNHYPISGQTFIAVAMNKTRRPGFSTELTNY